MPKWADLYNVWDLQGKLDPIQRRNSAKDIEGAGVVSPEVLGDIRNNDFSGGSGKIIKLRDSQFLDLSNVSSRISRYKEYTRLMAVPECESAITIFADETCVVGSTLIATPF